MTLRFSKGLRNFINEGGSVKQALNNGALELYTGTQPSSADDAVTGTLLARITDTSGSRTLEVLSVGSVDLTGGASGSVDAITVNSIAILPSAVSFNTSLAQTAQDVCDAINNNPKNLLFTAFVSNTDKINIQAKPGLGSLANGWVVASTVTTITKTDANMAGGVTAANGLKFGDSAAGVLEKLDSQTWSGTGLSTGTAGWFRFVGSVTDPGTADSSEVYLRMDGAIATSGSELNSSNTNVVAAAPQTVADFTITLPAA